jgi:hypothetical protein
LGGEKMLNPWVETIAVGVLALSGLLAGVVISRVGKQAGLWVCLGTTLLILTLGAGWLIPVNVDIPIVFALVCGRARFVLLAFIVPLALAAARPYLPYKIERQGIIVLIALSIYAFAVFPFLGAARAGGVLKELPVWYDGDGVCLQSTPYTCGPAAAATALRHFGMDVSEGQIAVLSRSCPVIGTSDYDLTRAIRQITSGRAMETSYGRWNELPMLTEHQVLLAMLRQGRWMNHCVLIMKMTGNSVVFADPAEGLITLSKERFLYLWTGRGILLQNNS